MKTKFSDSCPVIRSRASSPSRPGLLLALVVLTGAVTAPAQSLSIGWWKIAGGGGTSTGGVYAVSGTVGQHDAGGPLTNGHYSVTGGFWAWTIAVQSETAPFLTIAPAAPGQATISWTPATPGFVLQATTSLTTPNWTDAASGTANPVTVPATVPAKFYRLRKP